MNNKAIFKKGKYSNQNQQISFFKNKTQTHTVNNNDQKNWIGDLNISNNTQIEDPRYYTQFTRMSQLSPQMMSKISKQTKSQNEKKNKSPTQLIQDILKGLNNNNKNLQLNPYYSKDIQQTVIQLLSNKNKLYEYIKYLQQNMADLDSDIVKNYQILILLLRQISMNDVQVKQSQKGMQIKFNKSIIQRQQVQIQRLQKQLLDKQRQLKQIVDQYDQIIKNFNDVIGKLVQNKDQNKNKDRSSFKK